MMASFLETRHLARTISEETGLEFQAYTGVDCDGNQWYLIRPNGENPDHTFAIRVTVGWRRLWIAFEPGNFAGSLLADMGKADCDGRSAFCAVHTTCLKLGAEFNFKVNGESYLPENEQLWLQTWKDFAFSMSKGSLEIGTDEGEPDAHIICNWTSRFTAAIVALLPTEDIDQDWQSDIIGYPEAALAVVKTNRYERDRRNRAAAIAIHGNACKGCGLEMGTQYGSVAESLIEIHHVTPVSQLDAGYVIDPAKDLIPLCPNCHAVVHRRDPPLSVSEIVQLLKESTKSL